MFGYSAEEAIGRSIRMIIPADRQGEEDAVLETIRAGRSVTHFETVRQRKDGSLIDISLTVSPIYDDAGVVIGASKIARDISAQKRASFDMRRLAAAVESSDDAIVTKTLDGVITSWNRAAERMFGYTEAEAVGRSVRMLIPDELQSEEDTVLARLRAGLSMDHYETIRQRKDGSRLSISLTVSPIRGEAGEIVGASKIARDITEQVRLRQLAREHAEITEKLSEVGVGRRLVARPRRHRPEGHRHGARVDDGGVRRVLLQRARRRLRRRLHALHAVGRAQGGVLEVPPSARHRGVRADVPRRGDRPARRRHGRPALRPEPAVSRHAAGAPAGAQLSGRAGAGHAGRRPRRPVLRQLPRRRVHRAAPADRRRHRRVGDASPSRTPGCSSRPATPTA